MEDPQGEEINKRYRNDVRMARKRNFELCKTQRNNDYEEFLKMCLEHHNDNGIKML